MLKRFMLIGLFASLLFLFYINNTEETTAVSTEIETFWQDESYQLFYLKFDDLTTNNFNEYLNDFKIIKIYPYINILYKDKINFEYSFQGSNVSNNLDIFRKQYFELISNYPRDKEKYMISGIPIDIVLVYTSNSNLYEYLSIHQTVRYSLNYNGNFSSLN